MAEQFGGILGDFELGNFILAEVPFAVAGTAALVRVRMSPKVVIEARFDLPAFVRVRIGP